MTDLLESSILESIPTGVFIVDAGTREILDLNSEANTMIGYSKDELVGRNCFETVCPRDRSQCPMIEKGKIVDSTEATLRKKDGSFLHVLKTAKRIMIDDRECIIESFYDITERKDMEIALRLSEEESRKNSEFLKIVIDSLPHPFYVIDPVDYSIIMANTATDIDTTAGKRTCHQLIHPSASPCSSSDHQCPLEEVKKSRQPFITEHAHYDEVGNSRILEIHGIPILDQDGSLKHMVEYSIDITERKQVEISLKQSEERYRRLVEVLPEGVIIGDDTETILLANKAIGKILGVDSNDLIGQNLLDFVDPRYASQISLQTRQRMSGTSSSYDIRLIRADGEPREVHVSAIPQLDDQNEIVGAIGVITDITDQKTMERNLRTTSYKLQERIKEIKTVSAASDLMKDITTPLETVLKDIIPIVCGGFQFPDISCGHILVDEHVVSSSNYNNPTATISEEIWVSGKNVGYIEIGYLELKPETDDGPFLEEEVSMVNQISTTLSKFIERQRSNQKITQQSDKLDAITRSTLDAIIMIDPEGLVQFWNPASEKMFGYSDAEVQGKNLHDIIA
ncbi:MAG: PAS domain S-box protein, partial [Candidatus Thorarchaeota archaeon]